VPSTVSDEMQKEFAENFERWVVSNGFREIVETFAAFFVQVFKGAFLLGSVGSVKVEAFQKAASRFDRLGVERQLIEINDMLMLDGRFLPMFSALNVARNCMAHRRGIVGLEDEAIPGSGFNLVWRTRTVQLEDGTDVSQAVARGEAPRVEAGGSLFSLEVDRLKHFNVGEEIRLTQHELNEICFGATITIEWVVTGLIELARQKGFKVDTTPVQATD